MLLLRINCGSKQCSFFSVILLNIMSVRILDMIICSGELLWMFFPFRDAIKLTLKVCFICLFVVIDPTNLDYNCGYPGLMLNHPQPISNVEQS